MDRAIGYVHSFAPVLVGFTYFAVLYLIVELYVVRKRAITDYGLRIVDFLWTCTSGVSLFLLLISTRDNALKDQIAGFEHRSSELREQMIDKSRQAAFQCMAGEWPSGAVKGKSYHENRNFVTDACSGVGAASNYVGRFFNDDRLWRMSSSLDTGDHFTKAFEDTFGAEFSATFASFWISPHKLDELTRRAFEYYRGYAQNITESKEKVGRLSFEERIVHAVVMYTSYWPFLLATAFAFRLGKSRLDLRGARKSDAVQLESTARAAPLAPCELSGAAPSVSSPGGEAPDA